MSPYYIVMDTARQAGCHSRELSGCVGWRCRRAPLSQPNRCRSTPIRTTELVPFTVLLDSEGVMRVQLVA